MPAILNFHIKPREKTGYSLRIFERSNSQPLAQTSFDYNLSYVTQIAQTSIKRIANGSNVQSG